MDSFREDGLEDKSETPCPAGHPTVSADIANSFTYASYQNAIPVVRSIVIENHTGRQVDTCVIELLSSPSFLRPKSWKVDRLAPGEHLEPLRTPAHRIIIRDYHSSSALQPNQGAENQRCASTAQGGGRTPLTDHRRKPRYRNSLAKKRRSRVCPAAGRSDHLTRNEKSHPR